MINLTKLVDYDLAKIIDNIIWSNEKYAAEELEVTWGGDYLTVRKYKEGELITAGYGDDIHGKVYFAPTYAELIRFLDEYYGIVIDFQPVFTFSTNDHIAYFYKVYRKNDKEGRLDLLLEEKEWMSSFKLAMKTIISELLERKFIS